MFIKAITQQGAKVIVNTDHIEGVTDSGCEPDQIKILQHDNMSGSEYWLVYGTVDQFYELLEDNLVRVGVLKFPANFGEVEDGS